jgi:hypothetical protein
MHLLVCNTQWIFKMHGATIKITTVFGILGLHVQLKPSILNSSWIIHVFMQSDGMSTNWQWIHSTFDVFQMSPFFSFCHLPHWQPFRFPNILVLNVLLYFSFLLSRPRRTWKDGIYTAMNERDLRMGDWNNRRQWNVEVRRRRQTI